MKTKLPSVIISLLITLSFQKTAAQHTAQLYGLTQKGGTGNVGTIFHYTPEDHTFHHDFSFDEVVHGKVSKSDVTDGGNGKVYGTTTLGEITTQALFMNGISQQTHIQNHTTLMLQTVPMPVVL